jgi:hypothetical protein
MINSQGAFIVRFEVPKAVSMKITVFWIVTPRSLVDCFHRKDRSVSRESKHVAANISSSVFQYLEKLIHVKTPDDGSIELKHVVL